MGHRGELTDWRGRKPENSWSANWEGSPSQPRTTVNHLSVCGDKKLDFENSHWSQAGGSGCWAGVLPMVRDTPTETWSSSSLPPDLGTCPVSTVPQRRAHGSEAHLSAPKKPINPWNPAHGKPFISRARWSGGLGKEQKRTGHNSFHRLPAAHQ